MQHTSRTSLTALETKNELRNYIFTYYLSLLRVVTLVVDFGLVIVKCSSQNGHYFGP